MPNPVTTPTAAGPAEAPHKRGNRLHLRHALRALAALPVVALAECPPIVPFEPQLFATDRQWHWRIAFTPDREEIYWSVSDTHFPRTREQVTILRARRQGESWGAPEVVPFSGVHADIDPFVTPDGRRLFFSSMRPLDGEAREDMNLWMVERDGQDWGPPRPVGGAIASPQDELYPSLDAFGNLYFGRRTGNDWNVWRAAPDGAGGFLEPVALGPGVNTPERWEFNPEISPDGRTLLFVRLERPGDPGPAQGHGWGDILVAHAEGEGFGPARNLGPCVNSELDEFHPTALWEEGELIYVRYLFDGGTGNFYRTRLPADVRRPPQPPP